MVKVRRYAPADCDAVAELWLLLHREATAGRPEPEGELRESFRRYIAEQVETGTLLCWVAEVHGRVVSTASILQYPIPPRAGKTHEGSVINVVTQATWRKKGIAAEVMHALVHYVDTSPLRRVWLRTTPAGRSVYAMCGFVADPTFMFYEPGTHWGR